MKAHVIGIPTSSVAYPAERIPKRLLLQDPSASQYRIPSSSNGSSNNRMNTLGGKADYSANAIREHVRLGPKISETLKRKLSLGVKILRVGGVEKIFKLSVRKGEKLLKVSQCSLSTTAGPIAGLLFISTDKVAFCSERSIKLSTANGEMIKIRYKVIIPIARF